MFQLIVGVVIAVLIVVYLWLRKSQHREANLPAVSEDVNLPANVPDSNPPQQQ